MADELPMNCRTPAITEYDGTSDPMEHLSRRKLRKMELNLFAVRQKDNEPLKEYLQRFNAAALEVRSTTQEVKASAFSQGLLDGEFFKSLAKKASFQIRCTPSSGSEIYIKWRMPKQLKKKVAEKNGDVKEETPSKKPRIDTRDKKPPFQRVNAVYSPLTVPITQAFMAIEEKGLLTRPRSWRDTSQRPKSDKFCRFHNDYGHTTEECRHLKDGAEDLDRFLGEAEAEVRDAPGQVESGVVAENISEEEPPSQ
ncbi:UNVERIFIED_CONTAM: hypothetical protein Sradi_3803400 [Sesamum radiatum]|uniref:Retrotransposon gag domain-containing protein n=1 Tax=Sesamum radiatum TaxID=300843 RepID=A0AAW2Q0I0_SESRA